MSDFLGSLLNSMQTPPTMGSEERRKSKAAKDKMEKAKREEKKRLDKCREKAQKEVEEFLKGASAKRHVFAPMDSLSRSIVHGLAESNGLASFSFGEEEVDRHIVVWKREFAPCDLELDAYRQGREWDPVKAKEEARLKVENEKEEVRESKSRNEFVPNSDFMKKYEHIVGKKSAKDGAEATVANKSYGEVPIELKRDRRTIEETMADRKEAKKQKLAEEASRVCESAGDGSSTTSKD